MTPLTYPDGMDNTYLAIHANCSQQIAAGAIHVYGWRNPGNFSPNKSSLQFIRYEGFDFIDLSAIKLSSIGDQSIFGLSVAGRWRWLQIAVFWPVDQFTVYMTDSPLTNIITIDDAAEPLVLTDTAISDDFTDGVLPVWDGKEGFIVGKSMTIKTAMPFKSGDGVGEFPDGGLGPIDHTQYQFTDDTYADFPSPEKSDG
jgi:hypothetical protein